MTTGPPQPDTSDAMGLLSRRFPGQAASGWLIALAVMVAGCGAPLDREDGKDSATGADTKTVSVSGRATFDYIPVVFAMGAGLDYNAAEARPVRGATVQLLSADRIVDTSVTAEDGGYRLEAPTNTEVSLRVRAELVGAESDRLARVLDNTRDGAAHAMDGTPFTTGETEVVRDVHAASGWTGTGYGEARAAAPFAILDVVHEAVQWIRSIDPQVKLVPLDLFWSPDNRGIPGTDGVPDYASGRIGGTHYRQSDPGQGPPPAIYLVGSENEDTDEYDRFVIAHEWAHYLADTLSRDDSIGGRHTLGEQLDPRVAFSEGLANALAAVLLGDSEFVHSLGPQQGYGARFSIENVAPTHPGWFNEASVMAIVYDLIDPAGDDGIDLGFDTVYRILVDDVRETPALTTLFPFIHALKIRRPDLSGAIDALAGAHRIDPVTDAFGSGETNSGYPASADTLPLYSNLTVNGEPVKVCSTSDFREKGAEGNNLGIWRFLTFTAMSEQSYTLMAVPTSAPPGARPDPVVRLYKTGHAGGAQSPPGEACAPDYLAACAERVSAPLPAGPGEYVMEVAEAANASRNATVKPIGRVCFDVTVRRETPAGVIGLSYESPAETSLGQPLEIRITVTSPHRVDSLNANVYAHEGLTVSAPRLAAPLVEAGEAVQWVLTVTPYVEGALRFSVLVQGNIDRETQAAQLTVPVQVGNMRSTRARL
ncbi:MAG: hypothetical protein OXQ29_05430 [Rhodospirillaceae bacterium]|nr:hypothetical protein [Rhodospirillaceae bacterium]